MADNVGMLLQAKINPKSIVEIQKQIKDITKDIGIIKINIDKNITKELTDLFNVTKNMQKKLATMPKDSIKLFNEKELRESGAEFTRITGTVEGAMKHLENRYKELGKVTIQGKNFDPITEELNRFTIKLEETAGVIKNYQYALGKLQDGSKIWLRDKITGADKTAEVQLKLLEQKSNIRLQKNKEELQLMDKLHTAGLRENKLYDDQIIKIEKLKKSVADYQQQMLGGEKFRGEVDIFSSKFKGQFNKAELESFRKEVENLSSLPLDKQADSMNQLKMQFRLMGKEAMQSGSVISRTFENMFKFLRYYLVGNILVNFANGIRTGTNAVRELNKVQTELSKITSITTSRMSELTENAYNVGRVIGRTGKEVLEGVVEFKRAGYELNEALGLSKQALIFTNIASGINDVKEASSSLIAILKGFKMESKDTTQVIDALNEVANNFALDTNNLTEIMKRASGALAQTGTSYEEVLGLSVGGYESLRNSEMVAAGLNMISQRLKGMKEDGTKVEGLIPKIQEGLDKYTKGAVSIIDKERGGLHSTYEILQQLSKVYPDLSDEAKAYVNELIAANRQSRILVAIMENWENVEKAVKSAENSLGSANRSNEQYMNSIEGKTKQLASSMEVFFTNLIDMDLIKQFVDTANILVNVLDSLINNQFASFILQVTVVTAGIYGLIRAFSLLTGTMVGAKVVALFQLMTTNAIGFSAAIAILNKALLASSLFKIAIIVGAITAVIRVVKSLNASLEEQKELVANLSTELEELKSKYDQLKDKKDITSEEKAYLSLLKEEIRVKTELLKIETKRAIQQEFFDRPSSDSKTVGMFKPSGADQIGKDIDTLLQLEKEAKNVIDTKKYNELNEKILELRQSLFESLGTITSYVNIVGTDAPEALVKLKEAIEAVLTTEDKFKKDHKDLKSSTDIVNDVLSNLVTTYADLEQIQDKVTSGYSYSKAEIDEIKRKYPQLEKAIYRTAKGWSIEESAIKDLRKEQALQAQQQIDSQIQMTKVAIENSKARISAIISEIKNVKNLADAYKIMANIGEKFGVEAKEFGVFGEIGGSKTYEEYLDKKGISSSLVLLENFQSKFLKTKKESNVLSETEFNLAKAQSTQLNEHIKLMREYDKLVSDAQKSLDDILAGRVSGGAADKSSKSSTKDSRQFLDSMDAEIRAIKIKNDNLLKTRDLLKEQYELAKKDNTIEGIKKQHELIGKTIENNTQIVQSFKHEQDLLHQRANELRKEYAQYDIDSWFDTNAEQTMAYIDQYNKATKEQQEEMGEIFTWVQKLKKAWMEANDEIKVANSELVVLNESVEELRQQSIDIWIKEQNQLYQEQQDRLRALEQIQERIVAIIRKRGEEEKKILTDNYNKEMKLLEDRHKTRMDNYKEELDEFKKLIQGKIDALDEQYAEEDYQEQLEKERLEAVRLQKEIDVLSLDDTLEARNKVIELRKKLAEQNEKIVKLQQKRERDLLKKSLQDQLKDKEKDVKDREKIADDVYNNERRKLEEEYEINKEYLERRYSDEQVYAEARKSIMRGQVEVAEGVFEDIYDAFVDFENKFGKGMGILGDIIKNDFIRELEKAQDAIARLDYEASNLLPQYDSDYKPTKDDSWKDPIPSKPKPESKGGKVSDMTPSDYNIYVLLKETWEMAKKQGNQEAMDGIHDSAVRLRKKYNIKEDLYDYNYLKNLTLDELRKREYGYKFGGKITDTGTLIAPFHGTKGSPEWILNDAQLRKTISNVTLSTVSAIIPKLPTLNTGQMIRVEKLINVEGNMTRDVLPLIEKAGNKVMDNLQKTLNKGGVVRPVKV